MNKKITKYCLSVLILILIGSISFVQFVNAESIVNTTTGMTPPIISLLDSNASNGLDGGILNSSVSNNVKLTAGFWSFLANIFKAIVSVVVAVVQAVVAVVVAVVQVVAAVVVAVVQAVAAVVQAVVQTVTNVVAPIFSPQPPYTPPTPPQYSCLQCRGTVCSTRYSSSPCSSTCSTNADCSPSTGRCVTVNTCGVNQCSTDADCRVPPNGGTTPPNGWTTPPSNGWTPPSNGWTPPPPPPKYSCNRSTWTCYQNSSGPYSSLSSCQSACVEPPCTINYFEFPKRAWVGYSITGKWSASDWCVDCDVTCTPYPECVWQEDNIGTGFDEREFTLEQSGDYIYTLTCYKQGGRDQKQVTVSLEALNLPWWQEIIPVLPGF